MIGTTIAFFLYIVFILGWALGISPVTIGANGMRLIAEILKDWRDWFTTMKYFFKYYGPGDWHE